VDRPSTALGRRTAPLPAAYAFDRARTPDERRRIAASRLLDPVAEPLLREAGLAPGMRVLELGSGHGDMAILLARLVEPGGEVLGVERSREAVALARRRIADAGLAGVRFVEGDVRDLDRLVRAEALDAVVGRLVLAHLPERQETLRWCAEALPPGALVWFLEADLRYDWVLPATPSWDRIRAWAEQLTEAAGVEPRMGPGLHRAFRAAGLPAPALRCRTVVSGEPNAPVWFWTELLRRVLDHLGPRAGCGDLAALEHELAEELADGDGVMFLPPLTAAWARTAGPWDAVRPLGLPPDPGSA
jgi:SAM-dependent methyltransferase